MSLPASRWAWEQHDLKASEKLVLLALADYADPQGVCFPKVTGIARKTGVSERSVMRAIDELEDKGLVQRQMRRSSGGRQAVPIYHVGRENPCKNQPDKMSPCDSQSDNLSPSGANQPDILSPCEIENVDGIQQNRQELKDVDSRNQPDRMSPWDIQPDNLSPCGESQPDKLSPCEGGQEVEFIESIQGDGVGSGEIDSTSQPANLSGWPACQNVTSSLTICHSQPDNLSPIYKDEPPLKPSLEPKPLNPLSSQDEGEDELWERFRLTWVLHPTDSFAKARREWDGLSIGEQSLAIEHAKGYQLAAKGQNYPISAKRYLADQLWQGQAQKQAQSQTSQPAKRRTVFVTKDSEAWWAWAAYEGRTHHAVTNTTTYLVGWWFTSKYPPGYVIGTFDEKGKRTGTEG